MIRTLFDGVIRGKRSGRKATYVNKYDAIFLTSAKVTYIDDFITNVMDLSTVSRERTFGPGGSPDASFRRPMDRGGGARQVRSVPLGGDQRSPGVPEVWM